MILQSCLVAVFPHSGNSAMGRLKGISPSFSRRCIWAAEKVSYTTTVFDQLALSMCVCKISQANAFEKSTNRTLADRD